MWSELTGELVFAAGSVVVAQAPPSTADSLAADGGSRDDDTAAAWGRDSGVGVSCGGGASGPALQQGHATSTGSPKQRLLLGHTAYVCCLALSGSGQLLASGQEGPHAAVRLWDLATGECLAVLCGECRWGQRLLDLLAHHHHRLLVACKRPRTELQETDFAAAL